MSLRQKLEQLAIASADTSACPDVDTLALYALGELAATPALQVAAHIRSCPMCSIDYAAVRLKPARPLVDISWLSLLRSSTLRPGLRGAEQPDYTYEHAELKVSLSITHEKGEFYRVSGRFRHSDEPLKGAAVKLKGERKPQATTSDDEGNFSFLNVYVGTYVLSVVTKQVEVVIRELIVGDPEP